MSAAQNDPSLDETTSKTTQSVPTDIDGDPITFDGNPAHAEGVAQEIMDCVMRTGQFKSLVTKNAVQAGYKLAIDSAEAIPFLNGVIADTKDILDPDNQGRTNFDASRPCPPTPLRVAAYTAGGGKHTFVPELTPAQGNTYVVAPHIIETDKLKFANWILSLNKDSDVKAELTAACNGDSCTLLGLSMLNFAKTADARDVRLVITQFKKIVAESHPGPVNAVFFSACGGNASSAHSGPTQAALF